MADVVIVCVRQDIERAEALAEMFETFGFSVSEAVDEAALSKCGASVVVWSDAALLSSAFVAAAERAVATAKGVVLTFTDTPAPIDAALAFDLTAWDLDPDDTSLDPLFFAMDRMMIAARAKAAPELEAPPVEAPLVLRTPRFVAAPAPMLRAMAMGSAVIGVALFAGLSFERGHAPPLRGAVVSLPAEAQSAPRVSFAEAAAIDAPLDLTARPVVDAPVGRQGLEPPSAARVTRAARTPAPVRSWDRPAVVRVGVEHVPTAFSVETQVAPEQEAAKPVGDKPDVEA